VKCPFNKDIEWNDCQMMPILILWKWWDAFTSILLKILGFASFCSTFNHLRQNVPCNSAKQGTPSERWSKEAVVCVFENSWFLRFWGLAFFFFCFSFSFPFMWCFVMLDDSYLNNISQPFPAWTSLNSTNIKQLCWLYHLTMCFSW